MGKWRKGKKTKKTKENFGTSIIEGMSPGPAPPPSSVAGEFDNLRDEMQESETLKARAKFASGKDVGDKLSSELTSVLSGIDSMTKGNNFYSSLEGAFKPPKEDTSVYGNLDMNYFDLKGIGKNIQMMFSELSDLISYFFNLLFSYLILIKKSIQLFIIEFNKNLQTTLTKIANALTNNTATESEINIFQDQTQKFLILIMVWIFVYNWYFVAFYLKDSDNIRYTFNADNLLNYSTILYGMFGPACRVLEKFNGAIITIAKYIQKYIPNNLIYIGLFFIFLILASANLQYVILVDFINAWNHRYGTSVVSVLSIAICAYYGIRYYFIDSGMGNLLTFQYPSYIGWPLFIILLFFYTAWTIAVNIPLGIFFVFGYLVLYSFFGVLFYQGTETLQTFTGISQNIASLGPDLKWEDSCSHSPGWGKFLEFNTYKHYATKFADWMTAYMFEIVIILMLLGGIGLYLNKFQSSISGKFSASAMSGTSIKQAFTYLFTWLIMINVLIIALLITFAIQKYRYIVDEMPNASDDVKFDEFTINKDLENMAQETAFGNAVTNNPFLKDVHINQEETPNDTGV